MILNLIRNIFEFRFIIEIFVLCVLFTTSFQVRKHFAGRVLLLVVICIVIAGTFFSMQTHEWIFSIEFTIVRFVVMFIGAILTITFCYQVSVYTGVFCVIGAYAIQHMLYDINEIIMEGLNLNKVFIENQGFYILYIVAYIIFEGISFALFYLYFISKFKKQNELYFHNGFTVVLGIFVNLYAMVFSVIFSFSQEKATEIFIIYVMMDILCCLFTMYLMFYMFRTSILKDELKIIQSILQKEKDQFVISQENVELINIKCHDLKHQLKQLSDRVDKEEIEVLKEAISIYDIPLTGNHVLDVVIAEKRLQCERKDIEFMCMVDGGKLGFMKETDIYSLFGNALDNAINSVKDLKNKDKRVISLLVKETIGLISIHLENYFQGELIFDRGLPVTTNKDKHYHGYGMKSMKYLTDKYDGELSIKLDGDVFNLNIIFPMLQDTV